MLKDIEMKFTYVIEVDSKLLYPKNQHSTPKSTLFCMGATRTR